MSKTIPKSGAEARYDILRTAAKYVEVARAMIRTPEMRELLANTKENSTHGPSLLDQACAKHPSLALELKRILRQQKHKAELKLRK
jgi:hypothetical protein